MLHLRTFRRFYYHKSNWSRNNPLLPHSDMRDLRERYMNLSGLNQDIKRLKRDLWTHTRLALWFWVPLSGLVGWMVLDARDSKRKFEIRYLGDMPQKEYEEEDYLYKFWEFALATTHSKYGTAVSSDNSKGSYVLMYHSSVTNPNHTAMQRFARLKRYIQLRKALAVESVFVALDPELDPKVLLEYVSTYGEDILPCWAGSADQQDKLKATFLNLGCIYVFERASGNVIYIADPAKYPLEALSNKILYTIGRFEDKNASREWMEKSFDVRRGQEDALGLRRASY